MWLYGFDAAFEGASLQYRVASTLRWSKCYNGSLYGGYSSAAERLTVAQDVVGSIPTSRPTLYDRCSVCPRSHFAIGTRIKGETLCTQP